MASTWLRPCTLRGRGLLILSTVASSSSTDSRCDDNVLVAGVTASAAAANGVYALDSPRVIGNTTHQLRYIRGVLDGRFFLEHSDCHGGWIIYPANNAPNRHMANVTCVSAWLFLPAAENTCPYDIRGTWIQTVVDDCQGHGSWLRAAETVSVQRMQLDRFFENAGIHFNPCWDETSLDLWKRCCKSDIPRFPSPLPEESFSCVRGMHEGEGLRYVLDRELWSIESSCFDDEYLQQECCRTPAEALRSPLVVPSSGTESTVTAATSAWQQQWEAYMRTASLKVEVPPYLWAVGRNKTSAGLKGISFRFFKTQHVDLGSVCDEFYMYDQYHLLRRTELLFDRIFMTSHTIKGLRDSRRRTQAKSLAPQDQYKIGLLWFTSVARNSVRTVVDLGASFGIVSITLAKMFPKAKVVAVEANPMTYRYLLWNVRDNDVADRVDVIHAAVVEDPLLPAVIQVCHAGPLGNKKLCHSVFNNASSLSGGNDSLIPPGKERVPTVSFDALMTHLGVGTIVQPHEVVLKMDCQMCEFAVFSSQSWHQWRDKFQAVVGEVEDKLVFKSFTELAEYSPESRRGLDQFPPRPNNPLDHVWVASFV